MYFYIQYKKQLARRLKNAPQPDIIITYNPLPWHVRAARFAKRRYGIPWISITLDLKNPGPNMKRFVALNKDADGQAILSWWGYEHSPLKPKIHIDAGVEVTYANKATQETNAKKVILYAGKYQNYGGADLLAEIVESLPRNDVEFWFLGKGATARLTELANKDPRVKLFGFVTEDKLIELCQRAHVFLNPRPNAFADNKMTFPSKIPFYMSFGKPIISTWTPGLSEDFRPYLLKPEQETGPSFSQKIDEALSKSRAQLKTLEVDQFNFLKKTRTWEHHAQKLHQLTLSIRGHNKPN